MIENNRNHFFDEYIEHRSMQSLYLTRLSLWWYELGMIKSILFVGAVIVFCSSIAAIAGAAIIGAGFGIIISGFLALAFRGPVEEPP